MKHGSLFAGIEGFGLGFQRAGFKTIWQVEKNKFCRSILRRHFPEAKRFRDVKRCGARNLAPVDVVTAGFPCQDLSVAGKRAGLGGRRSSLFWECARILGELCPAWAVIENVPGFFSSPEGNPGRDFAVALDALGELGCFRSIAWRVLDSQFFGVAQRRRRVFIVASSRIGGAEAVLFESESGGGNPAESGEAGKDIAFALAASVRGTGDGHGQGWNTTYAITENMRNRSQGSANYVATLQGGGHSGQPEPGNGIILAHTLSSGSHDKSHAAGRRREGDFNFAIAENQRGELRTSDVMPSLNVGGGKPGRGYPAVIANTLRESDGHHGRSSPRGDGCDNLVASLSGIGSGGSDDNDGQSGRIVAAPITAASAKTCDSSGRNGVGPVNAIISSPPDPDGVRDFAGLPEGLDSARYRALGNAVTASVAEWLAKRIVYAVRLITVENSR